MFDVGFSELIVIGIVALVVIGPEKLPRVARTLGHLLGRVQRYVNEVKSDINREIHLEDLKTMQAQMQDSVRALESDFQKKINTARDSVEEPVREVVAAVEDAVPASPVATHGLVGQLEPPPAIKEQKP